jgi:hypothetical protein
MELEYVQNKIYLIRGLRVMIDRDLAEMYGVETRTLNQAVKRNFERFPDDFFVPIDRPGISGLEITDCDIQFQQYGFTKKA